MKSLQRTGGIAAYVAAATFVFGLAMFVTLLIDYTTAADSSEAVEFLVDNRFALHVWNTTITIVFGIALVPLVLALRDRLGDAGPLVRIASVFGFLWTGVIIAAGMVANIGYGVVADLFETNPDTARTVWSALDAVQNGLGGGNEVIGGVWVLLLSVAALGLRAFPRWLNYLGLAMGVAGLLTVVPVLEDVGAVFGIGLIVWFVVVGRDLQRSSAAESVAAGAMPR